MAQLKFSQNYMVTPPDNINLSVGTMLFAPFNLPDSISLKTVNLGIGQTSNTTWNIEIDVGLYSLTNSSLSLVNSFSISMSSNASNNLHISATTFSATSNLTPGTWFFGFLLTNTSTVSLVQPFGGSSQPAGNAFPGSFIGGQMTESTNALPANYLTSNLSITGGTAMFEPYVLLSS